VAANLLILQGGAEPLSSAPVWAEPSQLLIGMWLFAVSQELLNESTHSVETTREKKGGQPVLKTDVF
jgi:hypothetical protein